MKADYFWIIIVVIAIIVAVCWKPISGALTGVVNRVEHTDKYEAGKAIFYDTTRWGEGKYMSCAMCHAADFVPDPNKKIDMLEYVAGQPKVLKGISRKYGTSVMDTGDELFNQVNTCLSNQSRMGLGSYSRNAKFYDDLLFYVSKQ
jgi:hypothetical protein